MLQVEVTVVTPPAHVVQGTVTVVGNGVVGMLFGRVIEVDSAATGVLEVNGMTAVPLLGVELAVVLELAGVLEVTGTVVVTGTVEMVVFMLWLQEEVTIPLVV